MEYVVDLKTAASITGKPASMVSPNIFCSCRQMTDEEEQKVAKVCIAPAIAATYTPASAPKLAPGISSEVRHAHDLILSPGLAVSWVPQDRCSELDFFRPDWRDIPFFPDALKSFSWHSTKSLSWDTEKAVSGIGVARTLTAKRHPRLRFQVSLLGLSQREVDILLNFVTSVKGAASPFLWLDCEDCKQPATILPRDGFGYYRFPVRVFPGYTGYAPAVKDVTVWYGDKELSPGDWRFRDPWEIVLREDGHDVLRSLPYDVRATYTYFWRVAFVDSGLGVEKIFYDINRSKSFEMEVVQ